MCIIPSTAAAAMAIVYNKRSDSRCVHVYACHMAGM